MFLGRTAVMGVALTLLGGTREARADEPTGAEPWRAHRLGLGLHLGAARGAGQADQNVSMSDRVGIAPMMLLEAGYRLHRNVSVAAIGGAGVAAKKPSPCPEAAEGFSCKLTNLFTLAALGRYHLTMGGPVEPWIGAGIGVGLLTETAERTEKRDVSFCAVGCDGSDVITRSRNRYGPEGILALGMSIRLAPRFSFGFGLHAFIGSYEGGSVQDESKRGSAIPSKDFAVAGGAHAIVLATGSFLVHLGS